jgi:hypothetical protein
VVEPGGMGNRVLSVGQLAECSKATLADSHTREASLFRWKQVLRSEGQNPHSGEQLVRHRAGRCVDPKIADFPDWKGEASPDSIDFHLTSASPARDAGVAVPRLEEDRDGAGRPKSTANDIGAYQFVR